MPLLNFSPSVVVALELLLSCLSDLLMYIDLGQCYDGAASMFVQLDFDDINIPDLIAQLEMLPTLLKEVPIASMSDFIQWFMNTPDRF